jgi:hypothetical protein
MTGCTVSDVFDVRYGHSLELNVLEQSNSKDGVAFVSRQMGYNGISAYVSPIAGLEPAPAGEISCALGGNGVLTTYIQERDFYCGRDVAILRPKVNLTKLQILFYCLCIKANRYRFGFGRQANKTLSKLRVPSIEEIPNWVGATNLNQIDGADAAATEDLAPAITPSAWRGFRLDALFNIKKGRRLIKNQMTEGSTPFIGAIDSNNGHRQYVSVSPDHSGNTITVNYNGNGVAEAFYQYAPYFASDDLNVLYPKFDLNSYRAMFLCSLIRQEKFRYNYGRKWHLDRMNETVVRLPVTPANEPDWVFMENYIKSLPYSKSI